MGLADTAKLVVDLSLKGNFSRAIGQATRDLGKLDKNATRAYRAGQQIGTGIKVGAALFATGVGVLGYEVKQGLDSLVELEKQTAQTNAVIKSTGGVAKISAAEVGRLAEKYEGLNATIGDEVIRSAENMILTFTKIRGKAFEPTLKAALDMNTALGRGPEGLQGTVIAVGKALNDPTVGLTALRRVGVSFDKTQIKRIKQLQKEGKLWEAQKLVLRELNKEFGGSFLAGGNTTAAKVAKFNDAIEDLQRSLAAGLLPVVSNIADALTELLADPQIQSGIKDFGKDLGEFLSPARIKDGIAQLKGIADVLIPAFKTAAGAIGLVIDAFSKLPPDLRNLLIGAFAVNKLTGGLVTNIAGGLASAIGGALKTIFAANVTVVGKNVTGGGGVPTTPGGAPSAAGKGIGALGKVFLVGEAIGLVLAVNEVRQQIQDSATQQAQAVHGTLLDLLGKPNVTDAQLVTALQGVNAGINALQADPLAVALVSGPALTELQNMRELLANRLPTDKGGRAPSQSLMDHLHEEHIRRGPNQPTPGGHDAAWQKLRQTQLETRRETSRGVIATQAAKTAINAVKDKVGTTGTAIQNTTRSSVASGALIGASATFASGAAIVAAIHAIPPPQITVTSVTRNTTITNRYGPPNGSSGSDSHAGGVFP